jgi:hypothetical protein
MGKFSQIWLQFIYENKSVKTPLNFGYLLEPGVYFFNFVGGSAIAQNQINDQIFARGLLGRKAETFRNPVFYWRPA